MFQIISGQKTKLTLLLPFKNKTFFWKLHFKIKIKTQNKRDRQRSKERENGGFVNPFYGQEVYI